MWRIIEWVIGIWAGLALLDMLTLYPLLKAASDADDMIDRMRERVNKLPNRSH